VPVDLPGAGGEGGTRQVIAGATGGGHGADTGVAIGNILTPQSVLEELGSVLSLKAAGGR